MIRRNTTRQFTSKISKDQKKYHKTTYQQNVKEPKEILQDNLVAKLRRTRKNIIKQFTANSKEPEEISQNNSQQIAKDQKNYYKTIHQQNIKRPEKYHKTIHHKYQNTKRTTTRQFISEIAKEQNK